MRPTSRRACSSSGMPTWCKAMALKKPNQQLRRGLLDAASALDDAAHDLFRESQARGDAALLAAAGKIVVLHKHIDALRAYADEVRDGRIVRGRVE